MVVILVIFTLCQALRKFGGVKEAEASRGGSVLGKWLGDHKEQHA